jgi:hypothetical protein
MKHFPQPIPGESSSSTTYKARIIGDYIVEQLDKHKAGKIDEDVLAPLMVAMHGPQGCGMYNTCSDGSSATNSSSATPQARRP